LPVAVILKRFLAADLVLSLGILPKSPSGGKRPKTRPSAEHWSAPVFR
jgi:hypothetical protein